MKKRKTQKETEVISEYTVCMTSIHGELLFLGYLKCFGSASWPQIMDYFRDGFTDFRPSIFPVMALRLTKKGLLTATKEGHSFYYDMTPSGQIYYKELVSQYHKFAGGFDHCLAVLEAEQKKAERTVPYL